METFQVSKMGRAREKKLKKVIGDFSLLALQLQQVCLQTRMLKAWKCSLPKVHTYDIPLQAPLTHVILLFPNHSNLESLILVVLEVVLISKQPSISLVFEEGEVYTPSSSTTTQNMFPPINYFINNGSFVKWPKIELHV